MEIGITLLIFIVTYALIISEKVNRSVIAMVGGLLIVALKIMPWESAITNYIDWDTLFLLIGMMIIVSVAGESGMFEYFGIKVAKKCKGKPLRIALGLGILTAVASMFLNNVTTILLLAPVTISITRILKISSFPYFMIQVFLSNIGGTATIVGDPPNTMISQQVGIGFVDFAIIMIPLVLIVSVVVMGILTLFYKKQSYRFERKAKYVIMKLNEKDYIKDAKLMKISIVVLIALMICFVFGDYVGIEPALIAMLAAFGMLLVSSGNKDSLIEFAYESVDWVSIFFFMGLFMLTGALEEVGVIDIMAKGLLNLTQGDLGLTYSAILWVSAVFSGFIDNIPFVSTMIPVLKEVAPIFGENADLLWYSLAAGACFGGNLTILGASANVVAVGIAKKEGVNITYSKFIIRGAFVTLASILISYIYLYAVFIIL
ncbi:Na+/H+ antiporter NhaD/arsenite permease-like protein [Bacilli bacterium PM5-3]|nr:Na+/H+ antiporter NhaD/arsenite permease-like protein [Bacilli bacterium PM5-3]MDH6604103.1 Na+/H+ antiporter NhaD/arsenite permease-like protein [Bacilli bacterium PM5-9]